jgi:hypothetical protein
MDSPLRSVLCLIEAHLEGLVRGDVISDLGPLLRLFLPVLEKAPGLRMSIRGLSTLGSSRFPRGR